MTTARTTPGADVTCARVCLARGRLLAHFDGGEPTPALLALAAAAPALLAAPASPAPPTEAASAWAGLFARAGSELVREGFRELVLVSTRSVRVLRAQDDGTALVALAPHAGSLGFVLSAVRARLATLEGSS